jgi:3-oxoacyl-[acyl-carrier-protein] synthase II
MTGHTLGSAGAVEAAICALSIREGIIPPTLRLDHVDPACEGLDLVPNRPRQYRLNAVLSNSFAFGGNNTSVVLRSVPS